MTPAYQLTPYVELQHPEWSKNSSIYEVNIRQFTPEGTFKAFEAHLPRLKELGVDIIWLMPIHPIGALNRKGGKGSYYSVKDYYGVNPEFGTLKEFKQLVNKSHDLGMKVILDWVANHSAWDHPLTKSHPEWYTKDHNGNFQPTPWYDWEDIIDFDYEQPGIWEYMKEAMVYWVKEANIDGYRCDVAGFIPVDFWEYVRKELDAVKPVFMLAEWESRDLHKRAFDMTYAWELWDKMHAIYKGRGDATQLYHYMAHNANAFPRNAYRMNFVDNHDKNSWEGTTFENFGEALPLCIVFTCTTEGMPLIYSGQEAGLDRALKFFEKDEIEWKDHPNQEIYRTLFHLKKQNKALWNGHWGGEVIPVMNDQPKQVVSFVREKEGDKVLLVYNFSKSPVKVILKGNLFPDTYQEVFSEENINLEKGNQLNIPAWGYRVYVKK